MKRREHRLIGTKAIWNGYTFTVAFVKFQQKGKKSILFVKGLETEWIKSSSCTLEDRELSLPHTKSTYSKELHEDYVYSDANWSSSDASL